MSDVVQIHVRTETIADDDDVLEIAARRHPFAVILTQECDLDWDFKARQGFLGEESSELKLLPNILLCELLPQDVVRPRYKGASKIWERIAGNKDERYHKFPEVEPPHDFAGEGVPSLMADFKRVFTIPTDELYRRLQFGSRRRAILKVPYLQDLSNRFGFYLLRVGLPDTMSTTAEPARLEAPKTNASRTELPRIAASSAAGQRGGVQEVELPDQPDLDSQAAKPVQDG